MISVAEADKLLAEFPGRFGQGSVALNQALGHLLQEDLCADRDFPPFDRVTMDGIGIDHRAFAKGRRTFTIENVAAAGSPQQTLAIPENCLEVMTGAITPHGVSAVIRYEDIEVTDGMAKILIDQVPEMVNIHRQGSDRKKGDVIVTSGQMIGAPEIGIAATVGKKNLQVLTLPPVLVVSNGDELVSVSESPLAHQIRSSNADTITALLQDQLGIHATHLHLPDNEEIIEKELTAHLDLFPIIILLGGSSKGKFDFIPKTLERLGVQRHFYKIAQRPGKPFWFGSRTTKNHVFALPGNPVSCFMCLRRYVVPWFEQSMQMKTSPQYATLTSEFSFAPDLTYFLQVKLINEEGRILANPIVGHGSGDLANLSDADAFLQLPSDRDTFQAGEIFPYFSYRS